MVRQIARLTLGPNVIPGEVDGRQPPLRETSEEVCAEAGHGPLGMASQGALSSVVLDRVVRLRKCQAGAVPPSTWCRTCRTMSRLTRRTCRTLEGALRRFLSLSPTPVGAQVALRTGACTRIGEAMARRTVEAAEVETTLGAATLDVVDVVAKEEEKDGEGGLTATPLTVTIGQRMMVTMTTNSPTVEEAVVVLVRETPCWRFSRG